MTTTNYQAYMNAFAELVAEALHITQNSFSQTAECSEEETENSLQKLRAAYNSRIKPLGSRDEDRDGVLESALGQYYGALVTHLTALIGKWKVISEGGNNMLIDLAEQRLLCCNEALFCAQNYSQAANAFASKLWQAELDLRSRVQLLINQIALYGKQKNLFYKGDGGRDVLGYSCSQLNRTQFCLSFCYYDGVDAINASLEQLLTSTEDREYVRCLSERTLGDKASLWRDYRTVTSEVKIPLVKISDLMI